MIKDMHPWILDGAGVAAGAAAGAAASAATVCTLSYRYRGVRVPLTIT